MFGMIKNQSCVHRVNLLGYLQSKPPEDKMSKYKEKEEVKNTNLFRRVAQQQPQADLNHRMQKASFKNIWRSSQTSHSNGQKEEIKS